MKVSLGISAGLQGSKVQGVDADAALLNALSFPAYTALSLWLHLYVLLLKTCSLSKVVIVLAVLLFSSLVQVSRESGASARQMSIRTLSPALFVLFSSLLFFFTDKVKIFLRMMILSACEVLTFKMSAQVLRSLGTLR